MRLYDRVVSPADSDICFRRALFLSFASCRCFISDSLVRVEEHLLDPSVVGADQLAEEVVVPGVLWRGRHHEAARGNL